MRYSLIREMDISNGIGVGISLFVQGCHFHCKGCFNQETWDFNGGKQWSPQIEKEFINLAGKHYIQRISFLGGEPLADENVETVLDVIIKLKTLYPQKKIWIFTGYKFEDLTQFSSTDNIKYEDKCRFITLMLSDIIADGQFELDKQDINNKKTMWVGSLNQRVIDVAKTQRDGKITLLSE